MDTSKLFDLTGKTAIVTGGAGGIGKACCEMLAAFGANVVVSDYNLEAAKETSKAINDNGENQSQSIVTFWKMKRW